MRYEGPEKGRRLENSVLLWGPALREAFNGHFAAGKPFPGNFRHELVSISPLETTIMGAYGLKARTPDSKSLLRCFRVDFHPPVRISRGFSGVISAPNRAAGWKTAFCCGDPHYSRLCMGILASGQAFSVYFRPI